MDETARFIVFVLLILGLLVGLGVHLGWTLSAKARSSKGETGTFFQWWIGAIVLGLGYAPFDGGPTILGSLVASLPLWIALGMPFGAFAFRIWQLKAKP